MTQPTLMAQLVELQEENARLREALNTWVSCVGEVPLPQNALDQTLAALLKRRKAARKEQK